MVIVLDAGGDKGAGAQGAFARSSITPKLRPLFLQRAARAPRFKRGQARVNRAAICVDLRRFAVLVVNAAPKIQPLSQTPVPLLQDDINRGLNSYPFFQIQ